MRIHTRMGHKSDLINIVFRTNLPVTSRVAVGYGALDDVGRMISQSDAGSRVLVLCQPGTRSAIAEPVLESVNDAGFDATLLELPDGEACKSHEQLLAVWSKLQELNFDRSDTLVAVGGGAITDLAGFAASTYLRGINAVLVPTTLLAQVDAAIGGKTGINLPSGKNLAGTFYFPSLVVVDPAALSTLPEREIRSGLGEIIKYALIETTIIGNTDYRSGPRSLYALLKDLLKNEKITAEHPALEGIIAASIKMKLAVVAKDPHEGRLRRCLNLGHTLGHAVEKVSNYAYSHGEAVAIGTVFACRLAERLGMLEARQTDDVIAVLESADLPWEIPGDLDRDALWKAMAFDKKRKGDSIKFVLPSGELGVVDLDATVELDELKEFL